MQNQLAWFQVNYDGGDRMVRCSVREVYENGKFTTEEPTLKFKEGETVSESAVLEKLKKDFPGIVVMPKAEERE